MPRLNPVIRDPSLDLNAHQSVPQRPDHPLADAKEFKRILAELHVDKAANAVDELTSWFDSLKHAEELPP
jgi:hypothetical protein